MEKSGMYYVDLMLRYWYVVVFFAVIAGIASYFSQSLLAPQYQASVSVFVGNALSAPGTELSSFESAERLAVTYAQLVRSYDRLTDAINEVDPAVDIEDLRENLGVQVIPDTSILIITVKDTDPERAAALANAIANDLIQDNRQALTAEQQTQLDRLEGQIESIEELIEFTNDQYAVAIESDDLMLTVQLTNQLNSSYSSLALLENGYQGLSNRISSIEVIDIARPDYENLGLSAIIIALGGSFLGIAMGVTGVVVADVFDTTLRTEEDITSRINAPIFGAITRRRWSHEQVRDSIASGDLLQTETSAQYRAALSNIMFSANQEELSDQNNMFVVASPQRGNGRTFTVVNLAVAAAELGLKVLVVDVDGQNPALHEYFGFNDEQYALSRLLDYLVFHRDIDHNQVVELHNKVVRKYDGLDNLYIITAGRPATTQKRTIPVLQALRKFLNEAREIFKYDIVILDTSASDESPDAVNLVAVTRSRILLLLEAKGTTEEIASKTAGDFQRLGYEIDGIILN